MAVNVMAALFGVVAGAVFFFFALIHLRAGATLLRGRTVTVAWVLAILYPLFILPIHNLLRGALLGEGHAWASVLALAFFVLLTVGAGVYFRGWLLFNVDTKVLGQLIRDACRAAEVPLQPEDPGRAGKGLEPLVLRLGEEGRELRLRREPASRFASLSLGGEGRLPWLGRFANSLREQTAALRSGRYYSRALIYLIIGLACLTLAAVLFRPELLGLMNEPVTPTTYYR